MRRVVGFAVLMLLGCGALGEGLDLLSLGEAGLGLLFAGVALALLAGGASLLVEDLCGPHRPRPDLRASAVAAIETIRARQRREGAR